MSNSLEIYESAKKYLTEHYGNKYNTQILYSVCKYYNTSLTKNEIFAKLYMYNMSDINTTLHIISCLRKNTKPISECKMYIEAIHKSSGRV